MYLYATVITVNDDQTTAVLRATTTNTTRFYGLFTPSAATNRVTNETSLWTALFFKFLFNYVASEMTLPSIMGMQLPT